MTRMTSRRILTMPLIQFVLLRKLMVCETYVYRLQGELEDEGVFMGHKQIDNVLRVLMRSKLVRLTDRASKMVKDRRYRITAKGFKVAATADDLLNYTKPVEVERTDHP